MRKEHIHIMLFLLLGMGTLLVGSCVQIRYTTTGASIPPEAKTFSVNYFQNNAQLAPPAMAQLITDALIDKIASQTRLTLTSGTGDIHFEGEITGYDTRPEAIMGDEQAAMNRLTITLNVRFINKYDPDNDFESRFTRFQTYLSSESLSAVETRLIEQINKELVEDIFNRALVNW